MWQIDLIDMNLYSHANGGNDWVLNCVDCFSKFAYSEPVYRKTDVIVSEAMKAILERAKQWSKSESELSQMPE